MHYYANRWKGRPKMKTFSMTDTGMLREMNQDFVFFSDSPVGNLPNLYIVADGMGGHKAGEYASRYTVERVIASALRDMGTEPVSIIRSAVQKANELLLRESREDEAKQGMGTTLVIATIYEQRMYVANVGDSRLYVVGDQIRQITRDHSLVGEMVRLGEVEADKAKEHPDKNIITRAIGAFDEVQPDFFEVELKDGEFVLLCSDGLTNMVDDTEIEQIVHSNISVEEKVKTLVKKANENGGKDNISVIITKPFSSEVKAC